MGNDLSRDLHGLHGVMVPAWLLRKRLPELLEYVQQGERELLQFGALFWHRNTKRLAAKAERQNS